MILGLEKIIHSDCPAPDSGWMCSKRSKPLATTESSYTQTGAFQGEKRARFELSASLLWMNSFAPRLKLRSTSSEDLDLISMPRPSRRLSRMDSEDSRYPSLTQPGNSGSDATLCSRDWWRYGKSADYERRSDCPVPARESILKLA